MLSGNAQCLAAQGPGALADDTSLVGFRSYLIATANYQAGKTAGAKPSRRSTTSPRRARAEQIRLPSLGEDMKMAVDLIFMTCVAHYA
jgi:hypothetical protein